MPARNVHLVGSVPMPTAKDVPNSSIATECGFGRRDPCTISELLRIHAEVADQD
jgi:hypothetical protein